MPAPQKRTPPTYKITSMAYGGYGVAKGSKVVFIPYTIEGEEVTAEIVREERTISYAEGRTLVRASDDRVYPACDHFGNGKCWGCQWQHIDYKAQTLIKFDVWLGQLYRYGNMTDKTLERIVRPVIASPQVWGYAHHATYKRTADGKLGFLRQDGKSLETIDVCHVVHEDVQRAYEALELLDFADFSALTIARGAGGSIVITLAMTSEDAPLLHTDLPYSVNAILPDNEPMNLVGDAVVRYDVGGRSLRATVGSFFRPNVAQIPQLIDVVLDMLALGGEEAVLELYGGVGTLSAFIAPRASLLTVVESYPPAATDAEENIAEFDNVDIVEGSVENFLETLRDESARYDAVVIDAPPQGLSQAVVDGIHALQPARMVFIANNPNAFWGGLFALMKGGYKPERLQPLDFAPHTSYVESVALLVRA
jgi:23S rRNA (uracil1939-C5)-methyltransferase